MCRVRFFLALAALSASVQVASSQERITLQGRAQCAECAIQRYRLSTIFDSTYSGGALTDAVKVHVSTDRSFFLTVSGTSRALFLANAAGEVRRRVGRDGDGPGEYRAPEYVMEHDSAYFIYDIRLRRVSVLAKPGLQLITTVSMPPITPSASPVLMADGSFLIPGRLRTPESSAHTLHVVSSTGQLVKSLRNRDPFTGGPAEPPYLVIRAGSSGALVADYNRYVIEKWNIREGQTTVYERIVDWFPHRHRTFNTAGAWFGTLLSMRQDDEGRLWTHVTRRRLVNTNARVDQDGRVAQRSVPLLDMSPESFESIIEVIDLPKNAVISTARIAGEAYPAWGGGFYDALPRSAPSGEPLIDVFAYSLRVPR